MFPNAGSTIYRSDDGEVTGWDNGAYDDGPDPDEFYNSQPDYDEYEPETCYYCGNDCQGECEPVRCEADIRDGVCQWRIPMGSNCPNESGHVHADGMHYDDGIPF